MKPFRLKIVIIAETYIVFYATGIVLTALLLLLSKSSQYLQVYIITIFVCRSQNINIARMYFEQCINSSLKTRIQAESFIYHGISTTLKLDGLK